MDKQARNSELGDLLKQWRAVRGCSQLDTSLDAGISQRQISFIESGRSVPSRSTLMGLAQALEVPLRERNALLLAAGYAPLYSDAAWNSNEMKSISKALERMVAQHEPYPAIVMDRYWNVFLTNDAAPRFFNCFIDLSTRPSPRNLLQLLAELLDYPEVQPNWKAPETSSALPMIPVSFVKDGATMNYSLITTVGTPQSIAAQELRVECMYPADDEAEVLHARLLASSSSRPRRDPTDRSLYDVPSHAKRAFLIAAWQRSAH